jgi:hypothetical protein
VVASGAPGALVLFFGELRFELKSHETNLVVRAVAAMDGHRTLESIASETGLEHELLESLASFLIERDLAVDLTALEPDWISPAAFLEVCTSLFPIWRRSVFDESLWVRLASGAVPRSLLVGWLVENYHFIQGVNDRLALAVTECQDPKIRPVFAQHFVEEYDHGRFFLEALAALGVHTEDVKRSRPLPGTLAVLNQMRSAARRDYLEYAVCSGFLESTGEDQQGALAFLHKVQGGLADDFSGALEPLAVHVRLDDGLGHPDNFGKICSLLQPISASRASDAINAGFLLLETLKLWARDIERSYFSHGNGLRLDVHSYRPSAIAGRNVELEQFTEVEPWPV